MSITTEQKATAFSPATHRMPQFELGGFQKRIPQNLSHNTTNILAQNIRVPEGWTAQGPGMTRTRLIQQRKTEKLPDISYDLDGDGIVAAREYFLATRLDTDQDGKLNPEEKRNAIKALKEDGFEEKFYWGVDKSGANRGKRLLQVRGKIVDADNFGPVAETYPAHPLALYKASVATLEELKKKRKQEDIDSLRAKKEAWDRANPSHAAARFACSEFLVDSPQHTSLRQIKDQLHRTARISAGLWADSADIKSRSRDPSLSYVQKPAHRTQREFSESLRRGNLADLETFGKADKPSATERLQSREDRIIRQAHKERPGTTYKQVVARRKKEMVEYNMRTFGKVSIGIHGKELPKFEGSPVQEYWKIRPGLYVPEPAFKSRSKLIQSQRFWARPDQQLLSDVNKEAGPVDPFKTMYVPRTRKTEVSCKVHEINSFTCEPAVDPPSTTGRKAKWTSTVQRFMVPQRPAKELEKSQGEKQNSRTAVLDRENEPLYSSFSPDKVFVDPLDKPKSKSKSKAQQPQPSSGVRSKSVDRRGTKGTKTAKSFALGGKQVKDSLLTRIAMKRTVGIGPDIDTKKIVAMGIRTGGF